MNYRAGDAAFAGFFVGYGEAEARHRVVAAEIRAEDGQRFHQHAGADAVDAHTAPERDGGGLHEGVERPFTKLAEAPKRIGSWLSTPLVRVKEPPSFT